MGSNNCFVNMYYGLSEAQNWRVITKEERYEVLAFLRPWRKHNTSQHNFMTDIYMPWRVFMTLHKFKQWFWSCCVVKE